MTCPHGMPSPASCMDCQYEGEMPPPPPRERRTIGSPFEARIEGWCPECDLPIHAGQMIVRVVRGDGDQGAYHHETCT